MPLAKEIKNGSVVNYEGAPVIVESISVQSPSARGAATLYKFRARNLVTRQKVDFTLKGTEGLPDADFERREVKLMYTDSEQAHFLDQTDFNQHSLALADLEYELQFLTEELEGVLALMYNGECVGVQLPGAVELNVTQCDPQVKGDSATKRTKPATLETGLVIQVPEYLEQGVRVKVDTRTAEFISRA